MATVTYDAYSEGGGQNAHTYSHVSTGSDLVMMVGVMSNVSGDPTVTYNSVSLTKVGATQNMDGSRYITFWVLVGPDSGTHTVSVTPSGSGNYSWSCTATATGALETQPDAEAKNVNNTLGTTYSNTVTSTVDNCLHFAFFHVSTETNVAAGASTTLLGSHTSFYGGFGMFVGSSLIATAGASTLNFTCSNSIRGSAGVTIAPKLVIDQSETATATVTDTVTKMVSRTITDTATTTTVESIFRVFDITTSDTTNVTDTVTKTLSRSIIDTITVTTAEAKSLLRSIVDSITTTDTVSSILIYVRDIVDTITTSDVVSRVGTFIREIIETITVTTVATAQNLWTKRTKPSSSWTDRTKPTSNWTDRTPPTTPWS